jgi:hypothetical protein
VRQRSFAILSCAVVLAALSAVPARAQRPYHGPSYYLGFGQWYPYPYPIFGFPPAPGFFLGDHFSSVRIQVPQRDALVYVDGYAAGIVDDFDGVFQRLELVPGHHEIVVYMPGYRTLRQNLYLNPGSTHTIKHTLVPLGPGETGEPQPVPRAMPPVPGPPGPFPPAVVTQRDGTLLLRVQPGDASVYIDGEQWRGPQGQDRLVIQLATGSHRVRVERPGFQSFDVQVEVRAGETTAFSVTLIQ